uniref:Uncharacterized protein n=1 Tax=Anguilla anguilla TaxID=7936 RepID=A0A0E9S6W4_ANGAN
MIWFFGKLFKILCQCSTALLFSITSD